MLLSNLEGYVSDISARLIGDAGSINKDYTKTNSKAAVAAGADLLIIEVHNDPRHAKCDGPQYIKPEEFAQLKKEPHMLSQFLKDVI